MFCCIVIRQNGENKAGIYYTNYFKFSLFNLIDEAIEMVNLFNKNII